MTSLKKLRWTDLLLPVISIGLAAAYYYYVMNYPMDSMTAGYLTPKLIGGSITKHFYLVFVSMAFAICTAVPLGIIISRPFFTRLAPLVVAVVNVCQAVPGLAVVALVVGTLGLGNKTTIFALWIYSLLPILNNTIAGMKGVDKAVIDSARGMGMTKTRILFKIEIPLAMSVIMAGIRTASVITVATAVIGAWVGAGGLGDIIIAGKNINRWQVLLLGAGYSTIIALLFDHVLGIVERMLPER